MGQETPHIHAGLWWGVRTDELDFELPEGLIAQVPAERRGESRLLHFSRASGVIGHRRFGELPSLLREGDLLVMNDARVEPAKVSFRKGSGGRVDGLFLAERGIGRWSMLLRNVGKVWEGVELELLGGQGVKIRLIEKGEGGEYLVEVLGANGKTTREILEAAGRMPLPPYIARGKDSDERDEFDRERYQTVYAAAGGSVASPTAGLHFTPEILGELERRGIERAVVTLDVGIGTFRPVSVEELSAHPMHEETWRISEAAAVAINRAKREGRRVVAIGTTAARVLESQPVGEVEPGSGKTSIFIYPPYQWKHVGALVTNFHLPRSTLIALVAALVGVEEQRRIYREAIEEGYKFFSYGDSSFLE